jgi:hypothetical protein
MASTKFKNEKVDDKKIVMPHEESKVKTDEATTKSKEPEKIEKPEKPKVTNLKKQKEFRVKKSSMVNKSIQGSIGDTPFKVQFDDKGVSEPVLKDVFDKLVACGYSLEQ